MLEVHPDIVQSIRKEYDLDRPGRMEEAIDILDQWIRRQEHFTKKDFPRRYLETTIVTSKGSIEKAKTCIDMLCTFKTMMPDFFGDYDIRKDFKEYDDTATQLLPLPKLTKDNNQVILAKSRGQSFKNTFFLQYFRITFMYAEYLKMHAYTNGFVCVLDALDANLSELATNINLAHLHQGLTIMIKGYGASLKSIHLVSKSKVMKYLVNLVKPVLSEKLNKRIHIHDSHESLHQHVQKDVLPSELGGEERSINELYEEWQKIIGSAEHRSFLREMCSARTDEAHRHAHVFNAEYMGMPGSFRALAVD